MSKIAEILAAKRAAAAAAVVAAEIKDTPPTSIEYVNAVDDTPEAQQTPPNGELFEPSFWFNPIKQSIQKALTETDEHNCIAEGCIEISEGQAQDIEEKMFKARNKPKPSVVHEVPEDLKKPSNLLDLLPLFPEFAKLKRHPVWNKLDISERVYVSREYTKHAQLAAHKAAGAAQEIHNAQRELEKAVAADEAAKAKDAKAARDKDKHETFSLNIRLNDKQDLAVVYALEGKSFVLTGAAGTGKTTAARAIASAFLERGKLGTHAFKVDEGEGNVVKIAPGIAFISYTRRATANIRRALHKDEILETKLKYNVTTIHKLLEYEPEWYDVMVDGEAVTKMRFVPRRDAQRLLDCKVIVIEESSQFGLDLYEKFYAAMRPGTILVFIGDLNQLPPVFGKSILNYALVQLPVVELTEVYRQALDSGIIVNAHRVLKGQIPEKNKDTEIIEGNSPTHVGQERMARSLGIFFHKLWDAKQYDPDQDIILSPWNVKPCGTDNLNNWVAQFLGEKRNAMVYEVLAGRRKLYLAVGDRVMFEKRDGIIKTIRHNAHYLGKAPQPASDQLTRFGLRKLAAGGKDEDFEDMATGYENINIDEVPDEEKKLQASHSIVLTLDDGSEETLSAVGDYSEQVFSLGYALTVHKAQGCEWRKVYVVMHKDHTQGGFLTRELLYTAITRAREKLVLIAKKDILERTVKQQRIAGNTLEEKILSINAGANNIGQYQVIKRA